MPRVYMSAIEDALDALYRATYLLLAAAITTTLIVLFLFIDIRHILKRGIQRSGDEEQPIDHRCSPFMCLSITSKLLHTTNFTLTGTHSMLVEPTHTRHAFTLLSA